MLLKQIVKPLIPRQLLAWRNRFLTARLEAQFALQSPAAVFDAVYKQRLWGGARDVDFFSGPGSHDADVVTPYVRAVAKFLRSLNYLPDVVDLGCGDFNIGAQVRPLCGAYIGCDIVADLIARNLARYRDTAVEFRVLDAVNDDLPDGDIVFIRQVLQHLSNAQVQQVLPKLSKYKWAVITEHLPDNREFLRNVDKPGGPTIRLKDDSGVCVESPPFSFPFRSRLPLCEVQFTPGRILTVAYQLRA